MDPGTVSLISAGLGALGGIFGHGQSGPTEQDYVMGLWRKNLEERMRIYGATNLEQLDATSLAQYQKDTEQGAARQMDNYATEMASRGYDPSYSDSERTRTIGRISNNASESVAKMKADLAQSRPGRQLALMPDPNTVAGGFNMASRLDSYRANDVQNEMGLIMEIAKALPSVMGSRGGAPVSPSMPTSGALGSGGFYNYRPPTIGPTMEDFRQKGIGVNY